MGSGSASTRRHSGETASPLAWAPAKPAGRYDTLWNMMRQASPLGTRELGLTACLVAVYGYIYLFSQVHHYTLWKFLTKLLWKNAATRPPILIVLILLGWAWVVRTCNASGMELELVLTGPTKPPAMAVSCALVLFNIFLSIHLFHLLASELPGVEWRPWLVANAALHVVFALVACAPHRWLHADARGSLLRTMWESLIAPFAPVNFWHVIVADYATSLAKAFADMEVMLCETATIAQHARASAGAPYVRTTVLWEENYRVCVESPFNPLMLALPFWIRLWQCLRVYSHTYELKNLWNALKYCSAFPLIYLGWHKRIYPSALASQLFVVAAIVNSTYTFVWDVLMDWGMLQWEKERGCWRLGMREQTVISPRKSTYAALALFNFALRFLWAMAVFGTMPTRGHGMFFFEVLEIVRRTVWAVFRIEWEWVTKVLPRGGALAYASVEKDSSVSDSEESNLLAVGAIGDAPVGGAARAPKGV